MEKTKKTFENIHDYIQYDSNTGLMNWKIIFPGVRSLEAFTTRNSNGYIRCSYLGVTLVHRLAWFMHYGKWPEGEIDHINRIKTDNRICNLRDVNRRTNMQNKNEFKGGATYIPHLGKWRAAIRLGDDRLVLGYFINKNEAMEAYEQKVKEINDYEQRAA